MLYSTTACPIGKSLVKRVAQDELLTVMQGIRNNTAQQYILDGTGCYRFKLNEMSVEKHQTLRSPPTKSDPKFLKTSRRTPSYEQFIDPVDFEEKKFNLDGPDGYAHSWRDLRKDPMYFSKRNFGGGSLMVWAAFSGNGTHLLPYLRRRRRANMIYQQDNASVHASNSTLAWFAANNVVLLDWPACSPDLNSVENLWSVLVRRVYANAKQYTTVNDLKKSDSCRNIPYRSKLTERIDPGQTLIIRGKTIDESKRFNINLHKDAPDFSGNDVPLHLSVRFDEGKLVFNSFTKNAWGKEERQKNPLKKGEPFDIRIRAHDAKFTICINRKEVKSFEHRIPLQNVTHLSIDGDVILNHVQWGGKYYPVPYESGIAADSFGPGKTLVLYGTPEKKAKRFNVNLLKKNGDIALHFNPRFDEKAVIRNSLVNGEWGNEEREGKNPFERSVGFDLEIRNEEFAFQIFVNGERFASYAHRVEPHELAGLQIQGDIELTGIQVVPSA
ncbi:unnamed protein product [Caenorhabditis auriculariae]|uniref:Galectin n=1 Tax=Caenorhabditis auriculariae TaxID=2777116 RepID=A0A8S1H7A1_9PELO|nr:unnamed protein product [Caenorhabditis auriculariae]